MKTAQLFLICLALIMTGCSTVDSRIKEKSAAFETLDPQTQARLKQSVVRVGDSTDMVYIALGQPDRTRNRTTAKGQSLTWIYNTYTQEYEGTAFVGYRRHAFFDRRSDAWLIHYEPVRADLYSDRVEEYMRVTFEDGKVTAIEQTNR
jgi:major membrane immunogen (membrane-anchored lipoprotein)